MSKKKNTAGQGKGESIPETIEAGPAAGPTDPDFPVVGIGASAGGLAAFEKFFSHMPANGESGMAFVLVQHLAPDHKSILCDLIKRYTPMQVMEAEDGMEVRPNCTYIIPPNRDLAFLNGRLYLTEPAAPRGLRMPIDFFFRSLAQDQHERAICIVLSGTGTDGTLGLKAIKGEGGMAMAQSPESTEYEGMPSNAIATGLVDYVLPPEEMPARIMAYAEQAFGRLPRIASAQAPRADVLLQKIFVLLRARTGHDFSRYKRNTIGRRVERRMAVNQIQRIEDYVIYLGEDESEVEALFRDLLIGVTSFFRDPEAYEAVRTQVLPRLFSSKAPGGTLRIWVPACSTGEEAYSIAMLMQECVEELKQAFKVQIFATDIDGLAIDQARAGRYPASIASDVSPERLDRFFTPDQAGLAYHIHKRIRDMLVFSEQDVSDDPPFSRLDLVSCRNLLIYMAGELQRKVISLFHYALNPGGFLFLGSSETVGDVGDLFTTVDRKWKIYERGEVQGVRPALTGFAHTVTECLDPLPAAGSRRKAIRIQVSELTERSLLDHYAPASALVNERGEILYIHGRTGKYLEPAPGEGSLNILRMARDGLRRELATALRKAATSRETVHYKGLRVRSNGEATLTHLTVRPVADGSHPEADLFLVSFEEATIEEKGRTEAGEGTATGDMSGDRDERIAALEKELRAKDEYLQTEIEELETSNEELQSANEELETSKEELQSVNEELATVNSELQTKVDQLSRANNDMNNLLAGTGVGTVFVDTRLRIQRFTPAATQVINLIESDVGRPVSHIVANLIGYDRLVEDVQAVLDDLIPREQEVRTRQGAWYLMRIRPYRTLENVIEGAVITYVDITEQKRIQETLLETEALRRLAVVVRDSRDAVTVHDFQGRIMAWNPGAERTYGWSEAEALTMNILDMVPESGREQTLAVIEQVGRAKIVEPLRTQRITRDGQVVDVWWTASALFNDDGKPYAVATTERRVGGDDQSARNRGFIDHGS